MRWATTTIVVAGAVLAVLSLYQVVTGSYSQSYGGFAVAQLENIAGTTNGYRIGENIAWGTGSYGTPRQTMLAWLHSARPGPAALNHWTSGPAD